MAADDQKLLMASDAGYGFVCTFNDLVARNRAGKVMITLPDNARALPPMEIHGADDMLLSITAAGRMLMFPVADLPQLSKGKGNKIVSIPAAQAAAGEDKLAWLFVLPPQASVTLHVGKRKADAAAGRSAEVPCRARSQGHPAAARTAAYRSRRSGCAGAGVGRRQRRVSVGASVNGRSQHAVAALFIFAGVYFPNS